METASGHDSLASHSTNEKECREIADNRRRGELLELAFERVVDNFADTDKFKLASTSVFVVYAHDNDTTSQEAESKLVQRLIHSLQRVRMSIISDLSPLLRDPLSSREEGKLPTHNILSNQFCLLPKRNKVDKANEVVSSVDKVIICSSAVLQGYCQDSRMKPYTKAIKDFYTESANLRRGTDEDINKFKMGMDDIVQKYCGLDGFHHVITEMAFLEIRAMEEKPKCHSIIPVILNGEAPPYDKLLVWTKPLEISDKRVIHESQILHKLFFRLLKRLFEDLQPYIKHFEDCYNNCVGMVSSDSELTLPSEPEFEKSISKEVLNAINRVTRDDLATLRTVPNAKSITMPSAERQDYEIACLQSLAFPEMNLRESQIEDEATGTCSWLLEHETFTTWRAQHQGLIWIMGKPGVGKSTLVKYALTSALERKKHMVSADKLVIASFFFHGRGVDLQKTQLGLYRSLLHQILDQVPEILSDFSLMFKKQCETILKSGEVWVWEEKDLQKRLKDCIERASKTHSLQLYVDALDEGGEKTAKILAKFFQGLACTEVALRICLSCRYHPIISAAPSLTTTIHVGVENGQDIVSYVQAELKQLSEQLRGSEIQELEDMILKKAANVFQWLVLVVPEVPILLKEGKSMKDIQKWLEHLPTELGSLYQDILRRIDEEDLSQSLLLMQWVCFAQRPLSLGELRHAMAIHTDFPDRASKFTNCAETDEQMELKVGSLSRGLAEVKDHEGKSIVQFIHESVKDYLLKSGLEELEASSWICSFQCQIQGFWMLAKLFRTLVSKTRWTSSVTGRAHFRLSRACIRYIAMEELAKGGLPKREESARLMQDFPFLVYALTSWVPHAELVEAERVSQKDLVSFLHEPSNRILSTWRDHCWTLYLQQYKDTPLNTTLLHIAARHGLLSVLKTIIESDKHITAESVDQKEGYGMTPLSWAADSGDQAVIKLLLDTGKVDADSKSKSGQTPLSWAAWRGHEAVVKLLLDTGKVDADSKSKNSRTPLSWAAWRGHEAVIKLLLNTGKVDADSKSKNSQTPLSWAAWKGHEAVVKLLLDTGKVDADSKDNRGQTPLSWAAKNGYKAVVKLLLDIGKVDTDSKSKNSRTPLSWAAWRGHEAVVKLLLDTGKVDADSKDNRGQTPLSWAAEGGHEAVVKLLLDTGKVKADSKDNESRTPLSWAADSGDQAVIRLLLDTGKVDADSKSKNGQTPLSWAAWRGHEAVVKLLLDTGKVDADSKSKNSRTPLSWAAWRGHEAVVKLLLDTGKVNADSKDYNSQTPLSWATKRGQESVVKLLLDTGKVDANSKDNESQTPLLYAIKNRHKSIVKLLLKEGAEVGMEIRDWWWLDSLPPASYRHEVEQLLAILGLSEPEDFYGLQQLFSVE